MLRITALSALTACLVGGCNVLPGAGPTAGAIASGAETVTSEGVFARY
ncbi:ABC-type xylose transport system permease subunit, partial [Methylobacterium sp. BE186]|nr:ABC-type xylose transport system permease subunit [Methylobacterium sp. BE186]